jgi:co-chaperonin GroES (HSP10)
MNLSPIKNAVLFQFLDETNSSTGKFTERSAGILYIGSVQNNQSTKPRWGKVLAVGPTVDGVEVGDFILIEAGKWTVRTEVDGVPLWKTDDTWIIGATTDEKLTYSY